MNPGEVTAVAYHAPCLDGLASAAAAYMFSPNLKFIPYQLGGGKESDIPPGECLLFLDCAPTVGFVRGYDGKIMILDHHIGNYDVYQRTAPDLLPIFHFDNDRSGCQLAWDFFHPGRAIPHVMRCIGERDLGNFLGEPGYIGLALTERNVKTIPELLVLIHGYLEILIREGKSIRERVNQMIEELKPGRIEDIEIDNLNYRVCVCKVKGYAYLNEIAEGMYGSDIDFVMMYYKTANGKFRLSFRTDKEVDLSKITQSIGGNGHARAAGAEVDVLPWGL